MNDAKKGKTRDKAQRRRCAVLKLLHRSKAHQGFPIAHYSRWQKPLLQLHQVKFVEDESSMIGGCLFYAFLTEETLRNLTAPCAPAIHFSEWNDGAHLCLIDALIEPGNARKLLEAALIDLFPNRQIAFRVRWNEMGEVRSIGSVRRRSVERLCQSMRQISHQ